MRHGEKTTPRQTAAAKVVLIFLPKVFFMIAPSPVVVYVCSETSAGSAFHHTERGEFDESLHEVRLLSHNLLDIFVSSGRFVKLVGAPNAV